MDSSDSVAIADHNEIDNEATSSSNTVQEAFDDFIYPYEDLTEKPHSEPTLHGALFHTETMDHVDDLAAMYTVNRMLPFDSPSPNSLALGDQVYSSPILENVRILTCSASDVAISCGAERHILSAVVYELNGPLHNCSFWLSQAGSSRQPEEAQPPPQDQPGSIRRRGRHGGESIASCLSCFPYQRPRVSFFSHR